MKDLNALLDALNARTGLSDRKLGPLFGVGEGAVSMWRTGRGFPADDKIHKIAELLELNPAFIAAVINAARAKSDASRSMWIQVAEKFKDAAVLAALAVGLGAVSAPTPAEAASHNFLSGGADYTLRRKRHWLSGLAAT